MRSTWRFLGVVVLLLAARAAGAGESWTREDAAHLLRRAAFGGTPEQIDRIHAYGRTAAVEYLISGKTPEGREPVFAKAELKGFEFQPDAADRKERQKQERQDIQGVRAWWLERMTVTDRPLEEKMVLFWHGLFCSGFREVREAEFMYRQNELFRSEALGNYKKLTHAIIKDPAMLRYLDAQQNVKGKPNENLARELMELFTMGEGQGYTEQDIKEVARALTGVAFNPRNGGYVMRYPRHDEGEKVIFGKRGRYGPTDVVDLIFTRPQPPQYLARRLWTYFVSPNPSPGDLLPITEAIKRHHFELRPALRMLLSSEAFYAEKEKFALISSPAEMMVGTVRNLEVTLGDRELRALVQAMDRMGQELMQPPNVRGWPGGEQWITSATLYNRYNACAILVTGTNRDSAVPDLRKLFPQVKEPVEPETLVDLAVSRFLQRPLHPEKKKALIETLGEEKIAPGVRPPVRQGRRGPMANASPLNNPDARIRQMLALLMSTPEYQVH